MITTRPLPRHTSPANWQQELAAAVTDPAELLRRLGLDPAEFPRLFDADSLAARAQFPLRVPESFVRRMRHGDVHDPLLRQVLPLGEENLAVEGFGGDPLGEATARRAPGLLQKYAGRALLVATGACAVHCRYCFRRDYDYAADVALEPALEALAADESLEEVILSGGDPLVLGNRRLESLLTRIGRMRHVRRLRIHTRTPIVLPSRVDDALVDALAAPGPSRVIVVHANHPAEIDAEVVAAMHRLRATGATLLNQTVLLSRVNDTAGTLSALSRALFDAGVLPYYLHLLDRVHGVAQFEVSEEHARALLHELLATLPGYLVPRLVREKAGEPSKSWIDLGPPLG